MSDSLGLGKAAKAVTDLVKPVYHDLAQPTVREVGMFAGESVRAILLPIRKAIDGYTEVVESLSEKVSQKLRVIPAERFASPPANVAGPILEAVRFVPLESPLHDLYANLLAKSMDAATASSAHPAFVAIINQLTPDEARILAFLSHGVDVPILSVTDEDPERNPATGRTWTTVLRNFTLVGADAGCTAPHLGTAYLDNLARLGVLEADSTLQLFNPPAYERLESSAEVIAAKAAIESREGHDAAFHRSFFGLTDFGKLLLKASIEPPAP